MEATAIATGVPEHPVEPKVRHIYVLARPIQAAGIFSILSQGKFPLCHWGVLLSELRNLERGDYSPFPSFSGGYLSTSTSSVDLASRVTPLKWGSLFELQRDPLTNQNKAHVVYDFGHTDLHYDWKFLSLRKIGATAYHDDEIVARAASITSTYPNYDGHSNNCQNFVLYLLDYLCPGASAPHTIQGLVHGLLSNFYSTRPSTAGLSVSRLPGSYPMSSHSNRPGTRFTTLTLGSSQTWYSARSSFSSRESLATADSSPTLKRDNVLLFPIVELDANSHPSTPPQKLQLITDLVYDLAVRFIQERDFQRAVGVLRWGLREAPEVEVVNRWLSGIDLLATLDESIYLLDRASRSLPLNLHNLHPVRFENLLNNAKAEKLDLIHEYRLMATKTRRILQERGEDEMERLGWYKRSKLKTVIAAFDVLTHTIANYEATILVLGLSEILNDTLTADEYVAVFLLATIGNTLQDTDFLANVLLQLVERNDPTFTWKVLRLASGNRTFLLSLESLIIRFVSNAEMVTVREFFEIRVRMPEFLGPALQWSTQIIWRLLERIGSETEIAWVYPFLSIWLVSRNLENPERRLIGNSLVDLAFRFGKKQFEGGSSLLSYQVVTARRSPIVELGAHHSKKTKKQKYKASSLDTLIIIEMTVASLVYWCVGREAAQRLGLTELIDNLLSSGTYKKVEELSAAEQNSCHLVLFGKSGPATGR